MKERYDEILKLKNMLEKAEIPFEFSEIFGGYHITYPSNKFRICSVIEHDYSYGNAQDLLEIKGLLTKNEKKYDDVIGYLSAEEVFKRIQKNWKKLRRCSPDYFSGRE